MGLEEVGEAQRLLRPRTRSLGSSSCFSKRSFSSRASLHSASRSSLGSKSSPTANRPTREAAVKYAGENTHHGVEEAKRKRAKRHEANIRSVSRALYRLIKSTGARHEGKEDACDARRYFPTEFDIEHFMPKTYTVSAPSFPIGWSIPCYQQRERPIAVPDPSVENIHAFIRLMFLGARLAPECMIVALIYVDRLSRGKGGICLTSRNWLPITMVALLTASKVWEDNPTWNGQFVRVYPAIPVRGLNRLECKFHSTLQYDLHISGKTYARYYFALRALKSGSSAKKNLKPPPRPREAPLSPAAGAGIPKYYLKLSNTAVAKGSDGLVRRSASLSRVGSEGKLSEKRSRANSRQRTLSMLDPPLRKSNPLILSSERKRAIAARRRPSRAFKQVKSTLASASPRR